jgi:hypothetical protein
MDSARFDGLARSVSTLLSRRTLAGAFGLSALAIPGLAEAKKKHKHKKKKKVKFNDFGCVNVGDFCKNSGQCCSGICQGKKGKGKCQAHDQSTCQPGQQELACGGVTVDCTTSTGDDGICDTTTGNAGYCLTDGDCFACHKDADCVPFCGTHAACIICASGCPETGGTACVGPSVDSCTFPL